MVFSDRLPGVPAFNNEDAVWHQTNYYGGQQSKRLYIADKVFGARERHFGKYVEDNCEVAKADIILCSTCYYFPLQTASRLARKYGKPLVVDLRDIAEQWGNVPYMTHHMNTSERLNRLARKVYEGMYLRMRNSVLGEARAVTTVSHWHQQTLQKYNTATHLIYNGFDETEFVPKDVPADVFRITYTGKIYNTRFRDPRLLLQAVGEMLRDRELAEKDVKICFRIDEQSIPELEKLAREYGVEKVCETGKYIPKSELTDLLHSSSILLVLTCKSSETGPFGILGTKFYEALGVEKPVLCVRSDEGALAEVISETDAGMAANTTKEVKVFISDKYNEWKQKGFTRQNVNKEAKQQFTRQYESTLFENYFRYCAGI